MVNVEINKVNNEIVIKIDGRQTSISKYNAFKDYATHGGNANEVFIFSQYPVLKEFAELGGDTGYFASKLKPGKTEADSDAYYTTEEYLAEKKKNTEVNRNLYNEIQRENYQHRNKDGTAIGSLTNWKINSLMETDDAARMKGFIEKNDAWIKENLSWFQEMVNKMKQFKQQLEDTGNDDFGGDHNDPNKDKSQEEKKKLAAKIEAYRNKVKGEIEKALNQNPKITSAELDPKYQSWENQIWNTLITDNGEKEIDEIKEWVLTDISNKRTAKEIKAGNRNEMDKLIDEKKVKALKEITDALQAARMVSGDLSSDCQNWREQIEQLAAESNANKIDDIRKKILADIEKQKELKVKADQAKKDQAQAAAQSLAQATKEQVDKMEDKKLEEAMTLFTRWEGELKNAETPAEIEARLMREKPELYREIIINALIERMQDYGIGPNDLGGETRKLLRGEITDVNKFKKLKDQAIKTIGTEGAKNKWTSLMNQAKALLDKAKNTVTEQIKKDIKAIQSQLEDFKSGVNSYKNNFYQTHKSEFNEIETKLEKVGQNQNQQPKGFFQPAVIIPLVSVIVLAAVITPLVIKIRKRKQVGNK